MDINKHRYYMTQVLLAVFRDRDLSRLLAFKGGTSLLMFHGLTRFSTDLDFNLLDPTQTETVFRRLRLLLAKYGTIDDEAMKFFGLVIVLNYGKGERMLKVEVSTRQYDNHYETINLLGTDIRVMTMPDMFAHKLCALGERITPRDIYDVWFFLHNCTAINENIVRLRTNLPLSEYLRLCAQRIREASPKALMQGLGEVLLDNPSKNFVKQHLIEDTASGLELLSMCPILANQKPTARLEMLDAHPEVFSLLVENGVDVSTVSETDLRKLVVDHQAVVFLNQRAERVEIRF